MRAEINELVLLGSPARPASGASVQVNRRDTGGAAVVYTSETGSTQKTNPLTTDSLGRIDGWVEAGSYTLEVTRGSVSYSQPFEAVIQRTKDTPIDGSGTASVGTTSVALVPADTTRLWVDVSNDSTTATVSLGLGVTAVAGRGIVLAPGTSRLIEDYTGAINAISTNSSTSVSFVDL